MTHQPPPFHSSGVADVGERYAELHELLNLVSGVAERAQPENKNPSSLDEGARLSAAYHYAAPIVQRRFDTLAAETAAWATVGVEALLAAGKKRGPSPSAAAALADDLAKAMAELGRILRL